MSRVLSKDQADYAEQTEQRRGSAQNRVGDILSWRFKAQMGTRLLKRGLDRPAGREPTDYLSGTEACIGGVKVLVPMCTLNVVDEGPI